MRTLVLGAGALGGYFGGRLLKGGADVTFLVRPGRAEQLRRDGLIVKAQDGEIRRPVQILQSGETAAPFDLILLCCKSYDLEEAMAAIAPAMGERSVVLPLLNGIGHINTLVQRFGARNVLGGLTAVNAALLKDGTIQQSHIRINITAFGELDGQMSDRCAAIQAALAAGDTPATVSPDILTLMWNKFLGFTCSATIASLTRSRAGAIARAAAGPAFVAAVLAECGRVTAAEGYPPPQETIEIIRNMFAQPDSPYGPSLLIDMEDGRRTEGEHTIGDMVRRAATHNIVAPILEAALCNLQAYEINRAAKLQAT